MEKSHYAMCEACGKGKLCREISLDTDITDNPNPELVSTVCFDCVPEAGEDYWAGCREE